MNNCKKKIRELYLIFNVCVKEIKVKQIGLNLQFCDLCLTSCVFAPKVADR